MKRSLSPDAAHDSLAGLRHALEEFARHFPGESGRRQPVHTVYGGAHLFKAETPRRLGELALRSLDEFAPDYLTFARALSLPGAETLPASEVGRFRGRLERDPEAVRRENKAVWLAHTIYCRVREKLEREPVEDFRVDFEDGYGNRPDEEEDGHAAQVAAEMAAGLASGRLSPFIGIRIKPLSAELHERAVRTVDIFLTALVEKTGGRLPGNFVVTLPKVQMPEQVTALVILFDALERKLGLPAGALKMELMVETPQSIINERGATGLPALVDAAAGRCVATHFGTYDYTASCNITAAHQHMMHPACDFARQVMQVALAGRGLWLSDGATNVMPVAPHRARDDAALTPAQVAENRDTVHRAWKLHFDHIQHSLRIGFYQGWDLHPAQLPTRYASVYAFFLEGIDAASERLRNFVSKAAQATLVGDVFDDAATGQGLLNFFLRAINCGAITEAEALPLTGLTLDELRLGSFVRILKSRRG
jgi:citrate lyase beta subunit